MQAITSPLLSTADFNALLRKLNLSEEDGEISNYLTPENSANCQDFSNLPPG